MADKIDIKLDTTKYRPITKDDINKGKQRTLKRGRAANKAVRDIDSVLHDTTSKLVSIGYRYNVQGELFQWTANDAMFEEVTAIMDEVLSECMDIIEENAIPKDSHREEILLAYLLGLGRRGKNMEETLQEYLWRYLYDIEAYVASAKIARLSATDAMTRILTNMNSMYTDPIVLQAMKTPNVQSQYLVSGGVHVDRISGMRTPGVPIHGSLAVENLANILINSVWWRDENLMFAEDEKIVGYYQLRGSSYPCTICDDEVGLHLIKLSITMINLPLVHAHCMCYRIPVYAQENPTE